MKQSYRLARLAACILLFVWTPFGTGYVMNLTWVRQVPEIQENMEQFRKMRISAARFSGYQKWKDEDYRQLAKDFLFYNGKIEQGEASLSPCSWYSLLLAEEKVGGYAKAWEKVLEDVQYFPVAEDVWGKEKVAYEDSWGTSRSFGGNRVHEGTDIMPSNNERGYFSVVSVSDGVVEKKGWLKLGGYRLGIRSPGGTYFYYAHLESYAEGLEEGSVVKAGQTIGKMGDSGYGEEGTMGKFDVHLHFGIYIKMGKKDISVNPYPILQAVERMGL